MKRVRGAFRERILPFEKFQRSACYYKLEALITGKFIQSVVGGKSHFNFIVDERQSRSRGMQINQGKGNIGTNLFNVVIFSTLCSTGTRGDG